MLKTDSRGINLRIFLFNDKLFTHSGGLSLRFYYACIDSKSGKCYNWLRNRKALAALPLHSREGKSPPDERKEGDTMYVTYPDLFQFCILIVSLVGLCYQIYKGKKK